MCIVVHERAVVEPALFCFPLNYYWGGQNQFRTTVSYCTLSLLYLFYFFVFLIRKEFLGALYLLCTPYIRNGFVDLGPYSILSFLFFQRIYCIIKLHSEK